MVTKGLLAHLGCDVTSASSSEECLHFISSEHKLIFVDVCVPGTDGYEIAVRIREKFANCNDRPLIVALTGSSDKVTKANCMRAGMDGVLMKPVPVDRMRSVLADLLEHQMIFDGM